ncbi:MAG: hypothetical protein ACODAD_14320, partial [Planctomycetota bacterium]
SAPLVQYVLSVSGLSTAIIGIGHVDKEPSRCQLQENLAAAQLETPLDDNELREVEQVAASMHDGRTNYFQQSAQPLGPPRAAKAVQAARGDSRTVRVSWQTAYAADAPLHHYSIQRDGREVSTVPHKPQLTKTPFSFEESLPDQAAHRYMIVSVDGQGRTAESQPLAIEALG